MNDKRLNVREVAKVCEVSEETVRRWIRGGDLPAYRLGRKLWVLPADLEVFIHTRA